MPVPSSITDLSTTAGSNSPGPTESVVTTDNYLRALSGFIAELRDRVISVKDYGAVGDGTTDDSTAITNAVTAAAGRTLYFPEGTYKTGSIQPSANTTVWLEPGVIISAKAGTGSLWRLLASNIHIIGNGAKSYIDGTTQTEHNIRIEGDIENISVDNLWLDGTGIGGAGVGDDCVYIGGTPASNITPRDVRITRCTMTRANRNCVSVVAVDGLLIENCDISGATGQAPRAGIDIEANAFMANGTSAVRKVTIRKNKIWGNTNAGVTVVWGTEVLMEDNDIYDNETGGVNIGSGTDFSFVPSALDTGAGWITLTAGGAGNLLCTDYGVYVGMQVFLGGTTAWSTKNASITTTRWTVVDIDSTQAKIRIGQALGLTEITTFLSADATGLSVAFYGGLYVGQVRLVNNRIFNNTGGDAQVIVSPAVDIAIIGNTITCTGNARGIDAENVNGLEIVGNTMIGTPGGSGSAMITVGCQRLVTDRNYARLFDGYGIYVEKSSGFSLGKDVFSDCGSALASTDGVVTIFTGNEGVISSVVYNSDARPSPKGVYLRNLSTSGNLVLNAVCRTAGSSNATSIDANGNKVVNSVVNDGTYYGEGSATWDPGSLVDGAGETSAAVTVTGAQLGDMVSASFSKDLSGITLTGWVSASNTCYARLQNETGGTIDLASGTLRIRASR
jgi:hypothetical protein